VLHVFILDLLVCLYSDRKWWRISGW